jgi:hypothetical protein
MKTLAPAHVSNWGHAAKNCEQPEQETRALDPAPDSATQPTEIMTEFARKILFVGYGAVAECTLPIVFELVKIPPGNITVMDFEDRSAKLKPWTVRGVRFVRDRVTRDNLGRLLGKYLSAGDLLIDLAWNIDACEILQWCHDHGVLYVNTSTELWDPYAGAPNKHPTERSLYWRHMNVRRMVAAWKEKGPSAVIEHGANPGLISHFTKQGLIDLGERLVADRKVKGRAAEQVRELIAGQEFNHLARKLGVKVIHCSERDTQITDQPKRVDEFVNTWSIEGFREEGTTTAEMGWGTHEKALPPFAYRHKQGPRNQICLARMGINTWVRSWVPDCVIHGMVVRHGEAFTISDKLTVWEKGPGRLPADGALCLLPVRLRHRLAERAARLRLPSGGEPAHHERRDHQRRRHPGGVANGARVPGLVDWQRSQHRGIPPPRAAPERHDHAGRHRGGGGGDVDDGESRDGRLCARRPAARVRAPGREALSRPVHLQTGRLDAAAALHECLPGLQPAGARLEGSLAIQEFPDQGRQLNAASTVAGPDIGGRRQADAGGREHAQGKGLSWFR